VLIAQDRAEAEVATADGEVWRSVVLRDATATLRLDALGLDHPARRGLRRPQPQRGQK